jgi:hypothetical protein
VLATRALNIAEFADVVALTFAAASGAIACRPRRFDVDLCAVLAAQALRVTSLPHPVVGAHAPPAVAGAVLPAGLLAVLADRITTGAEAITGAALPGLPRGGDVTLLTVLAAAALLRAVIADEVPAASAAVSGDLVDAVPVRGARLRRALVHICLAALACVAL